MKVVVWVTEAAWAACADAARAWAPKDAEIVLLHVIDEGVAEAAHGAFTGLLGRGHPHERDPGSLVETLSAHAADELLDDAAARLGRPAGRDRREGWIEHVVVAATDGADLLICARDGDPDRAGPHSLAPPTRFVVDHTSCPVLLIWPHGAPRQGPPPPPARRHRHGHGAKHPPPPPPPPPP